jgi:dihydrofolate reductase
MDIHLIWAQDINNAIGKNNDLPWHIPEDLKNFKKLTLNHPIIMGRKTWDSLKFKPLPGRRNIVLTSQTKINNADTFDSLVYLLSDLINKETKKIFVIGGAQLYKLFWGLSTVLHITQISEKCIDADTFFPYSMIDIKNNFNLKESIKLTNISQYEHWERK